MNEPYNLELETCFFNWLMLPSESYEANLAFLDAYIMLANMKGYSADFTETREYSRARFLASRAKRSRLWKILHRQD